MKHLGRIACIALLLSLAAGSAAFGAGFALYDFSARGNALGGALVGRADDPSALALNPAGITQIPGSAFLTSVGFLLPYGTVSAAGGGISTDQIDRTFILPSMYYTKQLNDRLWFGIGVMSRFGLGTDFPEDWFGRYNSYRAMIESVSVNPNIAWKVNDSLSLSLGVEALWFEADLRKKIDSTGGAAPNPATDIDFRLKGDDIAFGWNMGLHYRMDETTRIGLHYRSRVKLALSGTAAATSLRGPDSTGAHVDLTLPEMFMFGISKQVNPKLNVEIGAIYTGWESYDSLAVDFDRPLLGRTGSVTPKNWGSVWRYQIGFEYKHSPEWTWRLGYTYDQEPMPQSTLDYQVPTGDRQLLSVGFGYSKNNWSLDLAYTYLLSGDRHFEERSSEGIPASRSHDMGANIFLISFSMRL
ncbi:MAG: outer membrane protein transport protein [Aminivibrio sp.]|nr:outer membrane protein transport protein [Aminivibrio sp.]